MRESEEHIEGVLIEKCPECSSENLSKINNLRECNDCGYNWQK